MLPESEVELVDPLDRGLHPLRYRQTCSLGVRHRQPVAAAEAYRRRQLAGQDVDLLARPGLPPTK